MCSERREKNNYSEHVAECMVEKNNVWIWKKAMLFLKSECAMCNCICYGHNSACYSQLDIEFPFLCCHSKEVVTIELDGIGNPGCIIRHIDLVFLIKNLTWNVISGFLTESATQLKIGHRSAMLQHFMIQYWVHGWYSVGRMAEALYQANEKQQCSLPE